MHIKIGTERLPIDSCNNYNHDSFFTFFIISSSLLTASSLEYFSVLTLMVVAAGGRESSCSSTAKLSEWYSYEEREGVGGRAVSRI